MSKQGTIWTVVIVVVLIILALVFWGGNNEPEVQPEPAGDTAGNISGIVGENEISIGDQVAGSRTALVSSAFLQGDGYVAVHEKGADGRPAAVLGSSPLLTPGQSNNVSVPLSAAMVLGKTYIAMLHLDNNADAVFSEASDPAAQQGDGDEVLVEFTAKAAVAQ